jgi:hypothetical protein
MTMESHQDSIQPSGASFRDPSGFIFTFQNRIYRQINHSYQDNYRQLIESGLYGKLVEEQLLIPHQEVSIEAPRPDLAYKVIEPESLNFVACPYEMSFSQLKDAAQATLRIQKLALDFGMSLKDSSAYNIQFHHGKPLLIDTLSFETYQDGKPWVAYRQFCQHFLAPLSLIAYTDSRLANLLTNNIDGIPLDLASSLLPARTRLIPSLLLHIHLHAASQKKYANTKPTSNRSVSQTSLRGLIDSLEAVLNKLKWSPTGAGWAAYYEEEHSYTSEGLEHKQRLVKEYLSKINPQVVWDLGANTGMFSRIASDSGAYTVAFDFDPAAVELNYLEVRKNQEPNILPLVQNLANPSPAIGWQNQERQSFIERANADAVLALALVHHLAINNNVTLDSLANFMQKISPHLIIEFVPKSDPQVQRLLVAREDIFSEYNQEQFETAFNRKFILHKAETIQDSQRRIYLMERR